MTTPLSELLLLSAPMEPRKLSKEIKVIEEKEYINEDGKVVKERVVEVVTKVVVEGDKMDGKERRKMYYQLKKTELNELSRKKKAEKYANDPEYREKIIERSRQYKLKKKLEKSGEEVIKNSS
jgi:hypothetical protein